MAQWRASGGVVTLEPGKSITWTTTFGSGLDGGVVIIAPNIIDDVLGSDALIVVNQGVTAVSDNALVYSAVVSNTGARPVPHNVNIQNWL